MKKIISVIICVFMIITAAVTALADDLLIMNEPETVVGDVNEDGEANNKDVVTLFRYVSAGEKAEDETLFDFSGDGEVNNKDVVALFRYLSGTSVDQPGEESETEPDESEEGSSEESEQESEEETESESVIESETEPEEPIPDGAVQISSREELFEFADAVIKKTGSFAGETIVLTADIDLDPGLDGGRNWTPLSTDVLNEAVIDGRGHTISNMTITQSDLKTAYGTGFIGICAASLTIKNLTFKNADITSSSKHVGCVIGSAEVSVYSVLIENVNVIDSEILGGIGAVGDTNGISFRVGGVVGSNTEREGCNLEVNNCRVENTTVQGFHNISGVVGCTTEKNNQKNTFVKNCTVKNVTLKYSARYANSYKDNPEAARYFADIFYSINDHWSEYHTNIDEENGNTYENVTAIDLLSGTSYVDEEGKSADYEGKFPAGTNVNRPEEQRPH